MAYTVPATGPFYGVPFNQTYDGQRAPYDNLHAQIADAMAVPSRYAQSWPWANGAGRYAFGGGTQAYPPDAGRQAPWDIQHQQVPGAQPPAQGGQQPPAQQPGPMGQFPGGLFGHPPISSSSDFPTQQLDPSTLPPSPFGGQFSGGVPMPKPAGKSADAGMPSPADMAFMNLFHGGGSNGPVMQQSDYDFLAGNVLPYDIAGVSPALRQQARDAAVAQNPNAAGLWDRTPGITINLTDGHYKASGNSRGRK